MNFYFQTGEFLGGGKPLLELLVDFLGILSGAGVSILVFWLGNRKERLKEVARMNELRRYLITALNDLDSIMETQMRELKRFAKFLCNPYLGDVATLNFSNLNAGNIKWISKSDLYKIVVAENTDNLKNLNAELDYIDSLDKHLKDVSNNLVTRQIIYDDRLEGTLRKINGIGERMHFNYKTARQTDPNARPSPFEIASHQLFQVWHQGPDHDQPINTLKYYLEPLDELCNKNYLDAGALEIHFEIQEYQRSFASLMNLKNATRKSNAFSMRRLRRSAIRLEKIRSILDQTPLPR
jgi:hypothetical protein